jgi:rhodanese-related sulfurtransferase
MKSEPCFSKTTANVMVADVQDVSPKDVLAKLQNIILVDVRSEDEFFGELGHIKCSKLIPLEELSDRIDEILKDKPVVFVCRSGNRSAHACLIGVGEGLKEVYNLHGGMILWNKLGLERS